jgi:hypothetical protein
LTISNIETFVSKSDKFFEVVLCGSCGIVQTIGQYVQPLPQYNMFVKKPN